MKPYKLERAVRPILLFAMREQSAARKRANHAASQLSPSCQVYHARAKAYGEVRDFIRRYLIEYESAFTEKADLKGQPAPPPDTPS